MIGQAIFYLVLSLKLLQIIVADLNLEASPSTIHVGLTADMFVNCSITLDGTSAMAGIMTLSISRGDTANTGFSELATMSVFSPHTVIMMTQENVTSFGSIDAAGTSYVYLHWEYPTAEQSGTYRCTVQGLDNLGRSMVVTNSTVITTDSIDTNDLVDRIRDMHAYTQSLENKISSLENYTHALENKVTVMESQITDLTFFHNLEAYPLTYQSHKYYIPTIYYQDIDESEAFCQKHGGTLVIIDDAEEYQVIQHYIQQFPHIEYVMINGNDRQQEGTWTLLSSDDPLPFLDWYIPSASTGNKNLNCLSLGKSQFWRMDDYFCHSYPPNAYFRFMCEMA